MNGDKSNPFLDHAGHVPRVLPAMDDVTNIWREVRGWPPEQRLALATRLLQSLPQEGRPAAISRERREALRQLIGIWMRPQPLNDEQVERILEQERVKKYG